MELRWERATGRGWLGLERRDGVKGCQLPTARVAEESEHHLLRRVGPDAFVIRLGGPEVVHIRMVDASGGECPGAAYRGNFSLAHYGLYRLVGYWYASDYRAFIETPGVIPWRRNQKFGWYTGTHFRTLMGGVLPVIKLQGGPGPTKATGAPCTVEGALKGRWVRAKGAAEPVGGDASPLCPVATASWSAPIHWAPDGCHLTDLNLRTCRKTWKIIFSGDSIVRKQADTFVGVKKETSAGRSTRYFSPESYFSGGFEGFLNHTPPIDDLVIGSGSWHVSGTRVNHPAFTLQQWRNATSKMAESAGRTVREAKAGGKTMRIVALSRPDPPVSWALTFDHQVNPERLRLFSDIFVDSFRKVAQEYPEEVVVVDHYEMSAHVSHLSYDCRHQMAGRRGISEELGRLLRHIICFSRQGNTSST